MTNIKILVLLFSPMGRDAEAVIPLCWYLENVYKYKLYFGSMFDSRYLIDKYKPDVLLLTNIGGASFNIQAADYAYKKGVKVITLTAEGLFRKGELNSFIWGNNKKVNVNWHKMFVWSQEYLKMSQNYLPEYKNTFGVSGSTGIDRYKIYKFLNKKSFLKKYHKEKYKKIITYAGYTFVLYFDSKVVKSQGYSKRIVSLYRKDMHLTKDIIYKLIKNNKDILFVLKKHPGEPDHHMEIDYDWDFDNVIFFEEQEPLGNLINVCDLYMVYDSTTTLEAYALNKTVINLVPQKNMPFRNDVYLGNCICQNYLDTQEAIDQFFLHGGIEAYERKSSLRKKIVKDCIYSDDGKNSWRTAKKIDKFIRTNNFFVESRGISFRGFLIHLFLRFNSLFRVIPRFKNSFILDKYNNFSKFYSLKGKYYPQIRKFSEKKHLYYKLPT